MAALSQILLSEVSESYDVDIWNSILETLVAAMLKTEKLSNMEKNVRLAIAIAVVGSHRTEFYEAVFGIMLDWQHKKGCWWVIQEELVRHYYLGGFYEEVQAASANTERKQALLIMKGKLNELKTITDSIAHPILLKRLAILKHDLISLLDTLKFSPSMKQPLDDYAAQYPLNKFSKWFIAWAQQTMDTSAAKPSSEDIFKSATITKWPRQKQSLCNAEATKCTNGFLSKRKFISSPKQSKKNTDIFGGSTDVVRTQQDHSGLEKANIEMMRQRTTRKSLPKVNLAKDVLSPRSGQDDGTTNDEGVAPLHSTSPKTTEKNDKKVKVCKAAHSAYELLKAHRHNEFHKPHVQAQVKSPASVTAPSTTPMSVTAAASKKSCFQYSPSTFICDEESVSCDPKLVKKKLAPPSSPMEGQLKKRKTVNNIRTFDNCSYEPATGVTTTISGSRSIQQTTLASNRVCNGTSKGNRGLSHHYNLDMVYKASTITTPSLTSHATASILADIDKETEASVQRGPIINESSSALARYFVLKPIAVVRALSSEIWDTFSPHSQ